MHSDSLWAFMVGLHIFKMDGGAIHGAKIIYSTILLYYTILLYPFPKPLRLVFLTWDDNKLKHR